MKTKQLKCTGCGKVVANFPIPEDGIVRAYIQCPECVEKELDIDYWYQTDEFGRTIKRKVIKYEIYVDEKGEEQLRRIGV